MSQVRDADHTPIDYFTITFDELKQELAKLFGYAQEMQKLMTQSQQRQNQGRPPPVNPAQGPPESRSADPQHPALNAENLQQQQAELQKSRASAMQKGSGTKPPAAPTTTKAPVNIGVQDPRGQGVPQYPDQRDPLTVDKLVFPPSKKRKSNNQGASVVSTPAQMTPGSQSSPPSKVDSPEIQRATFKCQAPKCKHAPFTSKSQLDRHTKEVHPPKEEITDPVGYVLESLRIALNLDDSGKSRPVESKPGPDTPRPGVSSAPLNAIKRESSTPTAKIVQELKTPQGAKSSPASDGKSAAGDSKRPTQAPDPWANTTIPRQWFVEVFRDVADLNRPVSADFLNAWYENTAGSPPPSPPSSNLTDDKSSSHKSDISATDNLNITIGGAGISGGGTVAKTTNGEQRNNSSSWLPSAWFDDVLPGDMAALDMDGLAEMDWEAAFGKADDDIGSFSTKKRDQTDPSHEWLKAWAPEKLNQTPPTKEGAVSVGTAKRKI